MRGGWCAAIDLRLQHHVYSETEQCGTSEKRKKIEKKRGWNYSVDCGQLKGTRERDSYLFLPIRTVCIVYYYYVSALLLSVCFCPDTFLIGLLLSILFPSTVFYSLQLSCYCQCVPRTYTYWRKPLKLVARPWQPYPSTLSVDFVTFCAVYTHLGSCAVVGAEQQRKLPFLIQTRN